MIEIKDRYTGEVVFTSQAETLREAVFEAAKARAYLARANLAGADLAGAYLAGAYLAGADIAGADLADANLARADLADANLADANLAGANLAGANLARANLARADLAGADLAGADLAGAYLADAYLAGANLARANLAGADLAGADLAGAYLAGACLARANLAGADLAGAYLAGACLARAYNLPAGIEAKDPQEPYQRKGRDLRAYALRYRERYPEVPVVEKLDSKVLAAVTSGGGTLDMGQWHSDFCETTHCRAGWAIHLAGDAGYALERKHGPQRAGAMIYRASTGRSPHFFTTTERALEDIRRCAELEASEQ